MHGGKCYDIKMMKAERERKRKINNFFRLQDAFSFILFVLRRRGINIIVIPCSSFQRFHCMCQNFDPSMNVIELNCMHETNKIELKLIEVDACSYLGLLSIRMGSNIALICWEI